MWEEHVQYKLRILTFVHNVYLPEDSSYFFANKPYALWKLDEINGFHRIDTSRVKDMSYMFYNTSATSLSDLDISGWDTSNVENMSHMFGSSKEYIASQAAGLPNKFVRIKMNNIDTSKVKDMSYMFENCINLLRY